jgi:integrase
VQPKELTKPASRHTRWHACATHVLQDGDGIGTIQELLGHRDVKTTMLYTHVLNREGQGVWTVSESGRRHRGARMLDCTTLRPNIRPTGLEGETQRY